MTHVFACLVHEHQESVVDLVRNLATLEPDATIVLYNGGADDRLLARSFRVGGREPLIHPQPQRQQWGALHGFAIDCMRFVLEEQLEFGAMTIVDSDQLLLRRGYAAAVDDVLRVHPGAGMFGTTATPQPATTRMPAAVAAWRECELWLPYCRRFPGGEGCFPYWTFWPATVFSAEACRDLVDAFDHDDELRARMRSTQIFATEEIVLPTLVALHGHEVLRNPFSQDLNQYNVLFTPEQLRRGMTRPDVFWAHPIPRRDDHPLRRMIRAQHGEYQPPSEGVTVPEPAPAEPLLLTLPLLERMRAIEGWLSDAEADLLIAGLARAVHELAAPYAVVEVGSYEGRSTSVLGGVLRALRADAVVHAIDPHDGEVGSLDQGVMRTRPTADSFRRNVAAAGLDDIVRLVQQRSYEVAWEEPISFILIDGLHDYANVSRDFWHFEPHVVHGGFVAFHDYASYWPGVRAFVDELLAGDEYAEVGRADSLILLRKRAAASSPDVSAHATRAMRRGTPTISCVMPTYARPQLALDAVARFLQQELEDAELIVVDDSPGSLAELLPVDERIIHVRLDRRHTIGAKRNLGCAAARAELFANWDDDDWYAPQRLGVQIAALKDTGADVVGLDRLLYYEPANGQAWRYAWPAHGRPWLHDATLAFTRSFWERNPFPDTNMGIDCGLLWTPQAKHLHALSDECLYVGIIHAHNTSPKLTSDCAWAPIEPEPVLELLAGDPVVAQLLPVS